MQKPASRPTARTRLETAIIQPYLGLVEVPVSLSPPSDGVVDFTTGCGQEPTPQRRIQWRRRP